MGHANFHGSEAEQERSADLLRLVPKNRRTVLDIGARDGHFSALLAQHFEAVTALDRNPLSVRGARVAAVRGDATCLAFDDASFDVVFCAEVLEHVPKLEQACREIVRVARHEAVIGVPYRQDTRVGRTTCQTCKRVNPPWGHVNTFDENKLRSLFRPLRPLSTSFVGLNCERTNSLSTVLMDWAGNPWGSYDQEERCIYCGFQLERPSGRRLARRLSGALAHRINRLQAAFLKPRPTWIHMVFAKPSPIPCTPETQPLITPQDLPHSQPF